MSSDFSRQEPAHLYIHVPFCMRKCSYCAFYSEADAPINMISAYLNKLELALASLHGRRFDSVFIGGGTPTWLSLTQLQRFFTALRRNIILDENSEISIECNPETLDEAKAELLGRHVNRVSLGLQSSRPDFRRTIGRRGSANALRPALRMLRDAGIDNLGIDLIYGIPGQSLTDWENELQNAVKLPVKHISTYALTLEEGARLARASHPVQVDDELAAEMWELTNLVLSDKGINRYEISNYASPGRECRHNLAIWHGERYLGLGPAAASFNGTRRWQEPADLNAWLTGQSPQIDDLPEANRAREVFAIGLRRVDGWTPRQLRKATGRHWRQWQQRLNPLHEAGLLADNGNRIACTGKGLLLWDEIALALI